METTSSWLRLQPSGESQAASMLSFWPIPSNNGPVGHANRVEGQDFHDYTSERAITTVNQALRTWRAFQHAKTALDHETKQLHEKSRTNAAVDTMLYAS